VNQTSEFIAVVGRCSNCGHCNCEAGRASRQPNDHRHSNRHTDNLGTWDTHTPWQLINPEMGDSLWAGIPPCYVTKPTRSTQPSNPPESLNWVTTLLSWGKGGNVTCRVADNSVTPYGTWVPAVVKLWQTAILPLIYTSILMAVIHLNTGQLVSPWVFFWATCSWRPFRINGTDFHGPNILPNTQCQSTEVNNYLSHPFCPSG